MRVCVVILISLHFSRRRRWREYKELWKSWPSNWSSARALGARHNKYRLKYLFLSRTLGPNNCALFRFSLHPHDDVAVDRPLGKELADNHTIHLWDAGGRFDLYQPGLERLNMITILSIRLCVHHRMGKSNDDGSGHHLKIGGPSSTR